jgi:gliding motility-associated-like protein
MKQFSIYHFFCISLLRKGLILCLLVLVSSFACAQAPVANFTATPVSGCSPLIVNFTDQSTGNPTSWQWNLGNGSTSNDQNPSTIYTDPGTYTVTLTVTNASGSNTITQTNYITVNVPPAPNFNANITAGCFPLRVQFNDLSGPGAGTITSWNWSFGNVGTSTLQNPNYTYTTSGIFSVSLTVTNSLGCTATFVKPLYINVTPGVAAEFGFSPPQNCKPPETINFSNASTGPGTLTYQWDFGDGNNSTALNPSNTYTTAGPFSVRLIVASSLGCIDTMTKSNTIQLNNFQTIITAPDSGCVNTPIAIQNGSTPIPPVSSWNFGDLTTSSQTDPIKVYSAAGTYTIKLVNQYNTCRDSTTKSIIIRPKPTGAFSTIDTISCRAPHTVNFQNTSSGGISYNWNFGDGNISNAINPVHTYTATGNYTVTLVVTNASGCNDTIVRTNYIRIQKPVLDPVISPYEGCRLLTVNFFANSTSLDSIASWFWDFGEGTTSTLRNPTNTFDSGSYNIKLRIVTNQGCIDSITIPNGVRVGRKPNAVFSAAPLNVCAFANVQFTDLSTGNPDEWLWDFGDNTTATQQNPTHAYQDIGLFTIRLIVYNNRCADTSILTNYIRSLPPVARFDYAVNCAVNKRQVQFTNESVLPLSQVWDFGDGTTSTLLSPNHTYASFGTYTVTLTVTNGSCTHQISKIINLVDISPDFTANKTSVCRNEQLSFTSNIPGATLIATYLWDMGDGNTYSTPNVNHAYGNSGNFNVRLITIDVNGCRDTILKTNYIRVNGTVANFTVSSGQVCVNSNIQLTNISVTDGVNSITQASWNMGNGTILNTLTNPVGYQYPAVGSYIIKLTIRDAAGCIDSITSATAVKVVNPKAAFTWSDTLSCPGGTLSFINTSTNGSGTQTYLWRFGDGATATTTDASHAYNAVGVYTVKLFLIEPLGCTDSASVNIRVSRPRASFSITDSVSICQPFEAKFTSTSSFYIGHFWTFGDGNLSHTPDPVNYYVTPGTYTATLIVTSPGGCRDTAYKTIRLGRDTGTFNYTPIRGCTPLTVSLQTRTDVPLTYIWDFGDGNIITTTDSNRVHTYDGGFFVPKVIIKDRLGCTGIIDGIDTIKALGANPNFGADKNVLCDSGTVLFTDSTTTADQVISYIWNFGDGTTSNSITNSISHQYTSPGLYTVSLTVRTASGCTNTKTKTAFIKVVTSPRIDIPGNNSLCVPAAIQLQGLLLNPDTSAVSWRWNVNGEIFNTQNPPVINQSAPATLTIQLIATNSSGCKDTADKTIVIHPLPVVDAGKDTTICLGGFASLNSTGAQSYVWDPSPDLNCVNCNNPRASATNDTRYYVTGTSAFGCVNRDSVFVKVKKPFTVIAYGSDTICIGEKVQLGATAAENYLWSPANGLSNAAIANPVASPNTTTTYTLLAFDSSNCFSANASVRIVVYEPPVINAGRDTTIVAGSAVQLNALVSTDVTEYLWSPSTGLSCTACLNPVATPKTTTTYRFIAWNPGICSSDDLMKITVKCGKENVFIPNSFTPNGDGLNDRFYVLGPGLESVMSMRIYNRWGNLVFERKYINANDPAQGWDGKFNGQDVPAGMYNYVAEIICSGGAIIPVQGAVTVIR